MIKILKTIQQSGIWAINGIIDTFKEENMFRVQSCFGLLQFFLGLLLKFNFYDMIIIFWVWITLISSELMNTGIENNTDLISQGEKSEYARRAKDSAAGGVFLISVSSWLIFFSILIHNILN